MSINWRKAAAGLVSLMGALVCATADTTAQQNPGSGGFLLGACQIIARNVPPPAEQAFKVGVCSGQLVAVSTLAPAMPGPLRSCPPYPVVLPQLARVLVAYLERNSSRMNEPFSGLALLAFADAWPCPRRSGERIVPR